MSYRYRRYNAKTTNVEIWRFLPMCTNNGVIGVNGKVVIAKSVNVCWQIIISLQHIHRFTNVTYYNTFKPFYTITTHMHIHSACLQL